MVMEKPDFYKKSYFFNCDLLYLTAQSNVNNVCHLQFDTEVL